MTALVERVGAGRPPRAVRRPARELAKTIVLALPLEEVSVRDRTGGVKDDPEDLALPHWAGVLPLRRVAGPPEPDAGVGRGTARLPAGAHFRMAHRSADAGAARGARSSSRRGTSTGCSRPWATTRCGSSCRAHVRATGKRWQSR